MKQILIFLACLVVSAAVLAQEGTSRKERTLTITTLGGSQELYVSDVAEISFGSEMLYRLQVAEPQNGTVEGEGYYPLGAKVTLTAKPKKGYVFTHWLVGGVRHNASALTVEVAETMEKIEVFFMSVADYKASIEGKYVDLGIGVLWATCNLGADNPEDYGDYYAWGEVSPKTDKECSWATYKYGDDEDQLTKYCFVFAYGKDGYADNKLTLDPEDDAASVELGGCWRMPTYDEAYDLCYNSNLTRTKVMYKYEDEDIFIGYKITSNISGYEDAVLFLPAAGYRKGSDFCGIFVYGCYWSSSLYEKKNPNLAGNLRIANTELDKNPGTALDDRSYGFPIRPVCVLPTE